MFDSKSRYADLETASYTTSSGDQIEYVRRRILPSGEDMTLLAEVTVDEGDRLDLIAHRSLGSSLHYWKIADATDAMNPLELTEAGQLLRIPLPGN
ncbi:MAG: hypothetical protein H6739_36505 [Alphaproteobacteria bacterium]|nr:hypothetical protein [Alphaproteobacteria bacterium]